MLNDNVFNEPAKPSSMSAYIDDYANPEIANDTNLGVAYFSDRFGKKLYLNVSVYSDEVKNPKLKINQNGDALLYLNTEDVKDMNDFDKYENTILFNKLNNLISDNSVVVNGRSIKKISIVDYIEANDDFDIVLIARNKEQRENGKLKGKKYKYFKTDFEVIKDKELEENTIDNELEFFDDIDLNLNKDVILPRNIKEIKNNVSKSGNQENNHYMYRNERE